MKTMTTVYDQETSTRRTALPLNILLRQLGLLLLSISHFLLQLFTVINLDAITRLCRCSNKDASQN